MAELMPILDANAIQVALMRYERIIPTRYARAMLVRLNSRKMQILAGGGGQQRRILIPRKLARL